MNTQITSHETNLDPSLTLRPATWEDIPAVAQLIYDVCEADGDTTVAVTPEELKNEWKSNGFSPERDAFVITTREGRVVGYEDFSNVNAHTHLNADGYVHPQFKNMGIGTALLRRVELRAQEEIPHAAPDLRVFLRATTDNRDEVSKSMFAFEGYTPIRYHWRMEINLTEAPVEAPLPASVELRPFLRAEHARAVWAAHNESFRDHWGSHDRSFEDWEHSKFDENFESTLWLVAWQGDEVAGFSQNRFRMGVGWVSTLGVRRPWRKCGLGLALLTRSFGEFYRRGMKTIGLGVDASNPTGATRLYQRAGMFAASEFIMFEKELRGGVSLA